MFRFLQFLALHVFITVPVSAETDEPPPNTVQSQIQTAVRRGLSVAEKAAANYPNHRNCFSCHHQTLPMLRSEERRVGKECRL